MTSVMNGGENPSLGPLDSNGIEIDGEAEERLQYVSPSGAQVIKNITHNHNNIIDIHKCDHDKNNLQPEEQNTNGSRESPPVDDPIPSEHRFSYFSGECEGSSNGYDYDEEHEEEMEGAPEGYSEYSDELASNYWPPPLLPTVIQDWVPPVSGVVLKTVYSKRERADSETFSINTGIDMDPPNGLPPIGDDTHTTAASSAPFIPGHVDEKQHYDGIFSNHKLWHILLILAFLALIAVLINVNRSNELPLLTGVPMGIVGVPMDGRLSLTANKTTGMLFTTLQAQHPYFWSSRYTDDLIYTGNHTLFVEYHQNRVCANVVDESIGCCKRNINLQTVCFFRSNSENRSEAAQMQLANMIVWDAEQYKNDIRVLAQHHQSHLLELRWNSTHSELIDFDGYGLSQQWTTKAFLHNGVVYALYTYETTKSSLQKLCIWRPSDTGAESSCMNIHIPPDPEWSLVKFWPAIGAKSLVLLHCINKRISKLQIGKTPSEQEMYPRQRCALIQMLLATGVPIAKSEPFEVIEGVNGDLTILGMTLAEDKDPTAFRVYKLGRTGNKTWELLYEKYTLLFPDIQ